MKHYDPDDPRIANGSRNRKPWLWPDCPECDTDVFVANHTGTIEAYQCHFCDTVFQA